VKKITKINKILLYKKMSDLLSDLWYKYGIWAFCNCEEIWRASIDFLNYEISSKGRCRLKSDPSKIYSGSILNKYVQLSFTCGDVKKKDSHLE
jgi:hypothetical protein